MGRNIKALRYGRKMSQATLAQLIGVAKSTMCQYENGLRTPDTYRVALIADALSVRVDNIVPGVSVFSRKVSNLANQMSIFDVLIDVSKGEQDDEHNQGTVGRGCVYAGEGAQA